MKKLTIWQKLIIGDIIITFTLFYWTYSELIYLNMLIRGVKIPLSQTSTLINTTFPTVVINPITGSFILVHPIIFPWLILIVILILVLIL